VSLVWGEVAQNNPKTLCTLGEKSTQNQGMGKLRLHSIGKGGDPTIRARNQKRKDK